MHRNGSRAWRVVCGNTIQQSKAYRIWSASSTTTKVKVSLASYRAFAQSTLLWSSGNIPFFFFFNLNKIIIATIAFSFFFHSMLLKKWAVPRAQNWIWTLWTWKRFVWDCFRYNFQLKTNCPRVHRKLTLPLNWSKSFRWKQRNFCNQIRRHVRKWPPSKESQSCRVRRRATRIRNPKVCWPIAC